MQGNVLDTEEDLQMSASPVPDGADGAAGTVSGRGMFQGGRKSLWSLTVQRQESSKL